MALHQVLFLIGTGLLTGVIAAAASKGDEPTKDQPSQPVTKYVDSGEQLVVELYVRSVRESAAFYERLGFKTLRKEPTFVELGWENSRLFLEQIRTQPAPPEVVVANIRIMVPDVDRYWKLCEEMQLTVRNRIGDRLYGLRDFTVVSPDGIGLRFASKLEKKPAKR
jgi:catechol 2,3-dioxygenase-like lactoylglutathione lyase family enzyme